MSKEVIERLLRRELDSHKYQYGHVLIVGGSPGMVGAPLLAGKAAMRAGAGLVTIAARGDVTDKLEKRVEEMMTLALTRDAGEAAPVLTDFIKNRKVSVIAVGPGLKPDEYGSKLITPLLSTGLPLVIDGGALTIISKDLAALNKRTSGPIILTPHVGEFQRLVGSLLPTERPKLKDIARKFARDHSVILVLKGDPYYLAFPHGSLEEGNTGNAGMATAGSGDVLTGVIAGVIAQGVESQLAVSAAAYLHGLAGDIAASEKTQPGMLAGDIIESLPAAFKHAAAE